MSEPYLAMYLTLQADFARPSSVIPVRAFAEGAFELREIIRDDSYFTTLREAKEAVVRVEGVHPHKLVVLLASTLAAQGAMMWRRQAKEQMKQLGREVNAALNPSSHAGGFAEFSIRFGMKRSGTRYPDPFVTRDNFEGDAFSYEWNSADIHTGLMLLNGNFFFLMAFTHPRGQRFFVKL
jgi:hypothetical protein